jgi:acetylglutamate kinase
MSVLSAKEKKQLYESLKKLGLRAAQQRGGDRHMLESQNLGAESTQ